MYYSSKYRSGHTAGGARWPASAPPDTLPDQGIRSVAAPFFLPFRLNQQAYSRTLLITHVKNPNAAIRINTEALYISITSTAEQKVNCKHKTG